MILGARAVEESDRWPMLDWRNAERVRSVSINDSLIDEATHAAWFGRLLQERSDEVLIVTVDEAPVGVVSLEGVDRDQATCSWGCHLGVTDVPPGVGAALPVIGLGFGFGAHLMRRMTAQVISSNRNMVGMHRRLAVPIEGTLREHVRRLDGTVSDVVLFGVLKAEWEPIRAKALVLMPSALRSSLESLLAGLRAGAVSD